MKKPVTCPNCSHSFEPGEDVAAHLESHHAHAPPEVQPREARRGSPIARTLRWLMAAVGLTVTLAAGVMLIAMLGSAKPTDDGVQTDAQPPRTQGGDSGVAARGGSSATPPRTPSLTRLLERIEPAVVSIEAVGGADPVVGAGFVVSPSGLIATNYHVTAGLTRGRVRFKSGAVYDIAGYAAVEPEDDLAILALQGAPANLDPLPLRTDDDPRPLSPVLAIGHPQGVTFSPFDGKVSRIVSTSDLSADARKFLLRHMRSPRDHRWIQHTAIISEGNSGGPLLNGRGEVIGVNTWVNTQTKYGYALHASYLKPMLDSALQKAADGEIEPLERHASGSARASANLERLARGNLEQLFDQARAMHWRPENDEQYATLQRLAAAITLLSASDRFGEEWIEPDLREELIAEADQVEQRLRKENWNDLAQFTIINDFAAQQLGRSMAGLFFFGTVDRVVTGAGDAKGMFVTLAGGDETIFISLTGTLIVPDAGTHCLILGIATGRSVRYGDNPLQPQAAAEVVSRTILPLRENPK